MQDPATEAEIKAQFEKEFREDKAAFDSLSPRARAWAERLGLYGFRARDAAVRGGRLVLAAAEILFGLPYIALAKLVAAVANGTVAAVKGAVGAAAGAGRALLFAAHRAAGAGMRGADFLQTLKLIAVETGDRWRQGLGTARARLLELRQGLADWAAATKEKIDASWISAKRWLTRTKDKAFEKLEYHGAIGLFRLARWLLDPRTPSGRPLLGNERLNKIFGFGVAAVGFMGLSYTLGALFYLGKLWHVKLTLSLATDKSPLYLKMLKQAVLHPLITVGITTVKFFGLPVVAATRQRLKTLVFTRGVAYSYNTALRERERTPAPETGLHAGLRRIVPRSLVFVEKFIAHVVEKASPEFYEARIRHYQTLFAARRGTKPAEEPAAKPEEKQEHREDAPAPAPVPIQAPVQERAPAPVIGDAFVEAASSGGTAGQEKEEKVAPRVTPAPGPRPPGP